YAIEAESGKLTLLNQKSTSGASTTHGVVDATGRSIVTVAYHDGYVCALPIGPDGRLGEIGTFIEHHGTLGPNKERQNKPHPHSTTMSPDNRFALVCDLGLDRVFIYRLDPAKAALSPNQPPSATAPAGAGPRHSRFSKDGRFFYVLNEMGGTICAYNYQ